MEIVMQIAMLSFAMIGAGWFMYLVGSHGWQWVANKLKARAMTAEAQLQAKASAALADWEPKIKDIIHSEMAKVESDIAALKAKVP